MTASTTAGPDRRHLAVVIQPPERHHRRQQHPDGHQHGQVLDGGQADEGHHDLLRQAIRCGKPEDAGQLVADQDGEQDAGHRQPGDGDFPENVAVEDSEQFGSTTAPISEARFRLDYTHHNRAAAAFLPNRRDVR